MRAEVISIGDELTSGQRLDTNTQWLSQRLGELGVETAFHTTVADDLEANVGVFRTAIERADLVIATGGLGPTADDLTRDALARAAGRELALDEGALRHIEQLFARRSRPMPERNKVQAYFPVGSRVVANPQGTAPGIDLDVPRPGLAACRVFALPGVPAEMKEMWAGTVEPAVRAMRPDSRIIRHRRIKCFGVGESDLEQMLPDLIRRGRVPSVGITVHEATITLRITAAGRDKAECRAAMEPTAETIYQCLGDLVFGEEDDELEDAVVRLLKQRDLTLAVVDWGTAGLLVQWLGNVDGAAGYYLGGLQFTDELTAAKWLSNTRMPLPEDDRERSRATAALAEAVRNQFGADLALATGPAPKSTGASNPTGTPNPTGDSAPPQIALALADRRGTTVKMAPYTGHNAILRPRAAKQGLNLVRLKLLHLRTENSSG